MGTEAPAAGAARSVMLAAPAAPASLLLLISVVGAFALFALLGPRTAERTVTVPIPGRGSAPLPLETSDITYIVVASEDQASRVQPMQARLAGEVHVRVVPSPADEEALIADVVELNGFRAQTGLPEVRLIDLR